jgi:hypothetical protein
MQAPCYGSSECYIAIPYFNGDPNTDFKVVSVDGVTEYLRLDVIDFTVVADDRDTPVTYG